MELLEKYKRIVDTSLGEKFPEWEELSPLDPLKLFAEGLVGSLTEIETRQTRYVDSILGTLPALFGFPMKRAQLPRELFQLQPHPKMKAPQVISKAVFPFQGKEGHCVALARKPVTVLPVTEFSHGNEEHKAILSFSAKGPISELTFFYVPGENPETAVKLNYVAVEVIGTKSGSVHRWIHEDLRFKDDTYGFTRAGHLRLRPKTTQKKLNEEACQFTVEIDFESNVPNGKYYLNACALELGFIEENVLLATLEGIAWEEIFLNENLLEPPDELTLLFPDEHTHRIHRLESDLLKLRCTEPDRFKHGYFYNPANHSIVIPHAPELIHPFRGGVKVIAGQTLSVPDFDCVPGTYQGSPGDHGTVVDSIGPIQGISTVVQREKQSEYLSRFYQNTHKLASVEQSGTLVTQSIRTALLDQIEAVRQVEFSLDPEKAVLSVYLLSQIPKSDMADVLDPAMIEAAAKVLDKVVPLQFRWEILPFRVRELSCEVEANFCLSPSRAGLIPREVLSQRLHQMVESFLLPPPFGSLEANETLRRSAFFESLKTKLRVPLRDHSHLMPSEVASIHGLVMEGATSTYLEFIQRRPGEILRARPKVQVGITSQNQARSAYSEEVSVYG